MSSESLLDELPLELDLQLELEDDLTVFLTAGALRSSGLRPGEPIAVDVHPLSLRLLPAADGESELSKSLPFAHIDTEGRIHLPFEPPRLTGRRILLQLRRRGPLREIHLLADSR